ncbi:C-C chemokine receptor type 3-like [Callorhinchus milii]|uniref:C-C chemokine receptor type 3-like n=1 Tax=Callorhinchus milii TaxID=7868 RepID=UPI001C3FCE68|nr:C-C chemokine receptor type 3-like [Callorhinchus milii]
MTTALPTEDYYNYDNYNYNYSYSDEDFVVLCENYDSNMFGATLTVTLYSLIFILSVVGNSLVLWIMLRYEKLKTITDIFIVNLAISDLLFAASLPFWAKDHVSGWVFGNAMCKLLSGVFFVGYYSGIMFLTLMTADRYFAVVHAVYAARSRKTCYAVTASLVVWAISLSASVPEFIYSTEITWDQTKFCMANYPEDSEHIWLLFGYYQQIILFFLIPLVVIVYCYYKIMNTVLRCKARKKYKAVKVILCIVVIFFLCWAPYNMVIFLVSLKQLNVSPFTTCEMSKHIDYAYFISRNLAYFHCCLNPVFYAFVGTNFRIHLNKLLRNLFPCMRTQNLWIYKVRSLNRSSSHEYSEAFVMNTSIL